MKSMVEWESPNHRHDKRKPTPPAHTPAPVQGWGMAGLDGLEGRMARYGWYLSTLPLYTAAGVGGARWEWGGQPRGVALGEWGQAGSHRQGRDAKYSRDANSSRKIAFYLFRIDSHKEPFQLSSEGSSGSVNG